MFNHILIVLQAEYANSILYIATLGFSKLSIISLLMILTASKLHRHLGLGFAAFMALWAAFSICVLAFQCGTTHPWSFLGDKKMCFNIVGCRSLSSYFLDADESGGLFLACHEHHQHTHRPGAYRIPGPHCNDATDELEQEEHHPHLFRCTCNVCP